MLISFIIKSSTLYVNQNKNLNRGQDKVILGEL